MSEVGEFTAKLYILIATVFVVIPMMLLITCKCFCNSKNMKKRSKEKQNFNFKHYYQVSSKDIIQLAKELPASLSKKMQVNVSDSSPDNSLSDNASNLSEESRNLVDSVERTNGVTEQVENVISEPKTKMTYFTYSFDNMNSKKKNPFKTLNKFVDVMCRMSKFINTKDASIVIYISSPGGYAYQFEQAYTQLKRLKDHGYYELIAVVDNYCASGGYMLASACDKIYASEFAQIGSIGVIVNAYNVHKLATKIGIEESTFKTGGYKGSLPMGQPYTEQDIEHMNEEVNETFENFISIVKAGRGSRLSDDQNIFEAKVWYAKDALGVGLVDRLVCYADYLEELANENNVIFVEPIKKFKWSTSSLMSKLLSYIPTLLTKLNTTKHVLLA